MQLHLVTDDEKTQILPAIHTVTLNAFSPKLNRVLAETRVRLEQLKISDTAAQLYLLQETLDLSGNRRYTFFAVPEFSSPPDTDRTYISEGDERYWAKGDEDEQRRLYLLTKSAFYANINTFGIGEAAGEPIYSSMLIDVIANSWR